MRPIIVFAALAASLASPAFAATATQVRPVQTAPQQQGVFTPSNTRPAWAAPQQCFTDDGYGRFTPCEGGGKGY